MPKARLPKNKELPQGCRWKNGAIRYRENGKEITLGKTKAEAFRKLATITEAKKDHRTIAQLLDRYIIDVLPKKAIRTQSEQAKNAARLRDTLGDNPIEDIRPMDIYEYIDTRTAKTSARREIALLSHAYTKAVEWGYIDKHPFKGEIRIEGQKIKRRYIEDWEILECLSLPSFQKKGSVKMIQAYIRLKLLLGLRMSDMLRLKVSDCKDDYLEAYNQKTDTPINYRWTDTLRREIKNAIAVRPVDISPYIFCNKDGECYVNENGVPSGFTSMWQRFMTRVLEETKLEERFKEHDLRAKAGSDADTVERAQELLAHADKRTTEEFYRRKIKVINPAK